MSARPLFAGPYFGEFGHEVLGTGLLRAKARGYSKVIVCSRPARAALYADIATEFRTHDIKCIGMCERATRATMPSQAKIDSYVEPDCDRFPVPDCGNPATEALILQEGIYHRLGTVQDKWREVAVIHARNRPHAPERNWPLSWWHRLARWIRRSGAASRVVCVGTRDHARLVEGCCDMRGSDLSAQMDIAASAAFVVGPSSGWMHLATGHVQHPS